jgi:casein kinase 1
MTTPHVIASSSGHHSQSATSNGIVGNHFRVGKKIGEGSFGVVFEGECRTPEVFLLFQNFLGS